MLINPPLGVVERLWRYPVKSMQGEELAVALVGDQGVLGDRGYALGDLQTGRVASAKYPQRWRRLLELQAQFAAAPVLGEPLPPVQIWGPTGEMDERALGEFLGRPVQLWASAPPQASLDKYWPPLPGLDHQDQVTQLFMPPGTFFDSSLVHLITTATLEILGALYPPGDFTPVRFRPNFLLRVAGPGFPEQAWIGKTLALGDEVRLRLERPCRRCVVTTLPQPGLPADPGILGTTVEHNQAVAGVRAAVVAGGTVTRGDPVWLE